MTDLLKQAEKAAPAAGKDDQPLRRSVTDGGLGFRLYSAVMGLLGLILEPLGRRLGHKRVGWMFLTPNLTFFTVFNLIPIGLLIYYSFSAGTSIFANRRTFVGLDNYQTIFDCENVLHPSSCQVDLFWRGVWNTAGFVVFEVAGLILLALVAALALNARIRARGFFRSILFYPVLLSPVVVALVWQWILQSDGLLNGALQTVGLPAVDWLIDQNWSRAWVIITSVWSNFGFHMLILLAGLQAINPQLYDAAKVDGASEWQQFRQITFPLLRPSLLVVFMLAFIRSVQTFDLPYILTSGGPGSRNMFIVQYIYSIGFATPTRNYGLAATASVLLAIVLIITSYIQMRADRRVSEGL
ncbi:MAG: sugar ABC transporter permease [Propionibacteriaceae bacterium]|nr:sugar ABC transporter permease [Propionibacteriaceae bacterium]